MKRTYTIDSDNAELFKEVLKVCRTQQRRKTMYKQWKKDGFVRFHILHTDIVHLTQVASKWEQMKEVLETSSSCVKSVFNSLNRHTYEPTA